MKRLTSIFLIILPLVACSQVESGVKKSAYHLMVDGLIGHTVPEVTVSDNFTENTIWLDAREKDEYKVSHISGAYYVGYDYFKMNNIKEIPKDANIVVYCSVGYRSEKIAEKLIDAGYKNVSNLYGGIFDWSNESKPLVDKSGKNTEKVHGYDKTWGVWIDQDKVVY